MVRIRASQVYPVEEPECEIRVRAAEAATLFCFFFFCPVVAGSNARVNRTRQLLWQGRCSR